METPNETWQVDVGGEIYETDFNELAKWVSESSVLENDKVRRGNLRWLEAGKVPMLREFFNAKENGIESNNISISTVDARADNSELEVPVQQSKLVNNNSTDDFVENNSHSYKQIEENTTDTQSLDAIDEIDTTVCSVHKDAPPAFVCGVCSHTFCKACPNNYGGSVRTCPYCGGFCKSLNEVQEKQKKEIQYKRDLENGFGLGVFTKALAYPFKYKSSLFWGCLFFAVLSYGQSAANMGSPFLIGAALICFMLANALTFGVLANTVDNFSQGKIDKDFMPTFEDFNTWDDVIQPFFLSIAVWISSFGLMFLLIIVTFWYAAASFSDQVAGQNQNNVATMPANESIQAIDHVKQVTEKLKKQNQGRMNLEVGEDGLTEAQRSTLAEEAEFQRLNDLAINYKKQQIESTFGKTTDTKEKDFQAAIAGFKNQAGGFLLLLLITLIWGLFYFPAACAVAGYTRSFAATLNPLVGLDTIKHLGFDYIKILLMVFLLFVLSILVGVILKMIFIPFDLPTFGNIPANFVGSFFGFYLSIAFAVILGYALYTNSEKLKLYK